MGNCKTTSRRKNVPDEGAPLISETYEMNNFTRAGDQDRWKERKGKSEGHPNHNCPPLLYYWSEGRKKGRRQKWHWRRSRTRVKSSQVPSHDHGILLLSDKPKLSLIKLKHQSIDSHKEKQGGPFFLNAPLFNGSKKGVNLDLALCPIFWKNSSDSLPSDYGQISGVLFDQIKPPLVLLNWTNAFAAQFWKDARREWKFEIL